MSRELQLNRIITEKIGQIEADKNVKNFVLEILQFEKSLAHKEGRIAYLDEYKKLIDKFVPKEAAKS